MISYVENRKKLRRQSTAVTSKATRKRHQFGKQVIELSRRFSEVIAPRSHLYIYPLALAG